MTPREIVRAGFWVTLRRAHQQHTCYRCLGSIAEGDEYYAGIRSGGGIGWRTHPDRVHVGCIEGYFRAIEVQNARDEADRKRLQEAARFGGKGAYRP